MYKKYDLKVWNNAFRHIYIYYFWKIFKKTLKMSESSRSLSPNKKKVKCSKLAEAATNKMTFKSKWKKVFPFYHKCTTNDVCQWETIQNAHYINFLWYNQMCSTSAKYEVWKILQRKY